MMMVKHSWVRLAKQQLCSFIMLFCTFLFSLLLVHVYDLKLPNVVFCRGWEYKTTISSFFCEVRYSPLKSNS